MSKMLHVKKGSDQIVSPYRKPDYPASVEEMADVMKLEVVSGSRKSRVYKGELKGDDRNQIVSSIVREATGQLFDGGRRPRVIASDVETIRERAGEYLSACEASHTLPTVEGLARALGIARKTLYAWADNPAPEAAETREFIDMFRDMCSDTLQQAALKRSVSEIMAIFINKCRYGMVEKLQIEALPAPTALGDGEDAQTLMNRYQQALPDITYNDLPDD